MADINREAEELAEAMRQAAEEIRRYGRVSDETADALSAGSKRRAKELDQAGRAGADALGSLASAAMGAGSAMLEGKKGAAAFNSSLDDLSKAATAAGVALTFLIPGGPVLKLFVAGVTAAVAGLAKYTQAANEMGDKLYKGFSKMQQSGANASDGLTGLFKDAKKMGLSMNELDSLVATVANNAKGLAGFSGSVSDGRKQLANIGKAMEGSRLQFLKMGIGMEELADATAGYMRLQSTTGRINRATAEENATAVKKYILEQDALTKLTGMTRKEQEDAREEVRSQERFAGKLEELRQQGRNKEAKELEDAYLILRSKSKQAAQGFADISTGNLQTEEAQKLYRATQGEALGVAQQVSAGQRNAVQAVQQIAERAGETATRFGPIMGQLGTYNDTFGDLSGALKLRGTAESDLVKTLQKIEDDRKKMGDGSKASADAALDAQANLRQAQIKANEVTENFVFKGVVPATKAMTALANATAAAAGKLDQLTPGGAKMTDDTRNQLIGGGVGAVAGYAGGKMLAGAAAKMVTGKMVGSVVGRVLGSVVGSVVPIAGTLVGGAVGAVIGDKLGDVIAKTFFGGEEAAVAPAEPRAAGGPVNAGKPYLVGERGPELMMPKNSGTIIDHEKTKKVAADLFKSTAAGAQSFADISKSLEKQEIVMGQMGLSLDNMTKDVKAQEQQTTKDTKQQKTFSLKSNRLMGLKDKLMDEEINLLEEQNGLLEKMIEHAEKLGGKEAGANVRKMFQLTRTLGTQGAQAMMAMQGGGSMAGVTGGAGGSMPGQPGPVTSPGNFQLGPQTQAGGAVARPATPGGGGSTVPTGPQPNYSSEGQSTGGAAPKQQQPSSDSQGKPRKKTDGVIYHHTGGRSLSGAMSTLQARGLGYHYLIGRDGQVHPYYPDNTVAYHAGPTDKNPGVGNWNTIGVAALANDNNDLTKEQLDAAIKLNQMLAGKYGFSSSNAFGHGAVTSRKAPTEGEYMVKAIKSGMSQLPSAQKGGIVSGPDQGYLAELHGQEAVVPLPDGKAIPVSLDIKQPEAPVKKEAQIIKLSFDDVFKDFSFGGMSELRGYNAGPMSTDLNAVKEIATGMGAFDKATQTITDVNTWKEIINSGIAMNYDVGMAKIGTEAIPGIGREMAQRVSEIVAEKGVDQKDAFNVMAQEFKTAMASAVKEILKSTEDTKGANFDALTEGIRDLVSKQSEANDISKKILSVSQ